MPDERSVEVPLEIDAKEAQAILSVLEERARRLAEMVASNRVPPAGEISALKEEMEGLGMRITDPELGGARGRILRSMEQATNNDRLRGVLAHGVRAAQDKTILAKDRAVELLQQLEAVKREGLVEPPPKIPDFHVGRRFMPPGFVARRQRSVRTPIATRLAARQGAAQSAIKRGAKRVAAAVTPSAATMGMGGSATGRIMMAGRQMLMSSGGVAAIGGTIGIVLADQLLKALQGSSYERLEAIKEYGYEGALHQEITEGWDSLKDTVTSAMYGFSDFFGDIGHRVLALNSELVGHLSGKIEEAQGEIAEQEFLMNRDELLATATSPETRRSIEARTQAIAQSLTRSGRFESLAETRRAAADLVRDRRFRNILREHEVPDTDANLSRLRHLASQGD
ncbi:MAG: hypothetical protein GY835_22560 [bacterium]|nr:hypothetical protein [bacterium]